MSRALFASDRARLAGALSLVGVVYLVTLALLPRQGLWSVDNANRFLQAKALADSGFSEYAICWPGRAIDPRFVLNPLRFDPEGTFQEFKDDQLISVFQPAFIVIAAFFYRIFGTWGLYLLPLGGALLMLAAVARLAEALRLGPGAGPLAVLLAGLALPTWFYALTFWEHTLAAALCVGGVDQAVRFLAERAWRRLYAAFALLAAAVFFRDVLGLFALVLLGLLLRAVPDRRGQLAWRALAVFGAGLALLALFQWVTIDRPLGFHAGTLLDKGAGPGAHLRERPLIFYLYLVNAHPNRAWSFLLATPFLAAFLLRPRLAAPRAAAAVPLWALAAAVAGALFLADVAAAPSPPQRLLVGNGFFLAAPIVILGFLRTRNQRPTSADQAAELVLAAVCWHFVLYCLVAPWAGAVSMHWGGRLQFCLYPLLAVLAAGTLRRWFAAAKTRLPWQAAAFAMLALVSCAGQVYSIRVLHDKYAYCERLASALDRFPQRAVLTNVWWAGHEMYASFFERPIFYIRTPAQFEVLAARLRAQGIDEALFVSRAGTAPRAAGTVTVSDGRWGFYALDLVVIDLQ